MVSGRRSSKAALLAMQAGSGVLLVLGAVTLALHGRRSTVLEGKISAVVDIESRTFAKQAGVYDRVLQQTSAAASRHDVSTVLRDIKAQQAAVEAQMKHLMHVNRAKASALSRVLNGDKFSAGLAARAYKAHASSATPTKLKLHPRSGRPIAVGTARPQNHKARAAGEPRASGGVATSDVAAAGGRGGAAGAVRAAAVALGKESGPSRVQTRIARLLADAQARLSQDEHSTLKDLTSMPERGPWFQAQQALSLDGDRRRVLGDERLVKLLRGMKASPSLLGSQNALVQHLDAIDMQARDDLQAAEMRARQRGIADEVNPHTKNILAAGVNPGHSRDMGLGGMEGDDEDFGTEALQRAGIRTDALPGMGSEYEKAIPLPFFDAPDAQQHNVTALLDGHRPISPAGEHMLHTLKVNLAAPNVFLYGNGASSTPKSDRYRTAYGEYGFFDGLEDQETNSTIARQHKPLSFWFEHPTAGSKALAEQGKVNVNGESTWDDILTHVPVFASNWSHPVATDLSRPPERAEAP